jgi:hypothetical protein
VTDQIQYAERKYKMTKKSFFYLLSIVVILLLAPFSVVAQAPENVYVDPNRTEGNEDGTQTTPYNTIKEGEAYAQSLPNGGFLYVKNQDGTWSQLKYVPSVVSGPSGTLLPRATLYILLVTLTLVLILVGWQFLRRGSQLQGQAKLRYKS